MKKQNETQKSIQNSKDLGAILEMPGPLNKDKQQTVNNV
jgi:hypothetical protein